MKIKLLVSWCLVFILLSACTAKTPVKNDKYTICRNDKYTIYRQDGKTYMEFHEAVSANDRSENDFDQQSVNICIALDYPEFKSISEMQEKIKNGDIPDGQIAALQVYSTNNVLEICDPDNLYDLALPNDLAYDYIVWHGDTYSFEFSKSKAGLLGYVVCCDQETFDQRFEEEYVNVLTENCSLIAEVHVNDRNAREVHYVTHAAELKDKLYSITTEQSSIYIIENYVLNYFSGVLGENESLANETSETIPKSVDILGKDGENYFYGWFMGFNERPSVEWLSSFGLVPSTANIAS